MIKFRLGVHRCATWVVVYHVCLFKDLNGVLPLRKGEVILVACHIYDKEAWQVTEVGHGKLVKEKQDDMGGKINRWVSEDYVIHIE